MCLHNSTRAKWKPRGGASKNANAKRMLGWGLKIIDQGGCQKDATASGASNRETFGANSAARAFLGVRRVSFEMYVEINLSNLVAVVIRKSVFHY
jgi:hypothetical protein